jgi:hypothetical protein
MFHISLYSGRIEVETYDLNTIAEVKLLCALFADSFAVVITTN